MHSKAQVSAEFFIFLGISFLIAVAFTIASLNQLKELRIQKEDAAVKDIALKLQKELLIASVLEDGYVRIFTIPDKLDRINYSLTVQNSTIIVGSKNSYYVMPMPKAIGNFSKGTNIINKTGGVIYINSQQLPFTDINICQNAQNSVLCPGLDITYGTGYQAACCIEHGLCC